MAPMLALHISQLGNKGIAELHLLNNLTCLFLNPTFVHSKAQLCTLSDQFKWPYNHNTSLWKLLLAPTPSLETEYTKVQDRHRATSSCGSNYVHLLKYCTFKFQGTCTLLELFACHFQLLLYNNSLRNILLFTPLQLFDLFSYKLLYKSRFLHT